MSDRQRVVYKTPLHRFLEISLVLVLTFGLAYLWHDLVPDISTSYPIVAFLVLGFATVPALGTQLAIRRGAPLITREERTRRYLAEIGPMGLRPGVTPAYSAARRPGRGARRALTPPPPYLNSLYRDGQHQKG